METITNGSPNGTSNILPDVANVANVKKRHAFSLPNKTQPLQPYTTYKPSGIAWLGDIPEHWEVRRLKNLGKAIIGITYNPKDLTDSKNGILVLRSSNVQNGKIDYKDCSYVNQQIQNSQITKSGDILICSRNGSIRLIGKNATIDGKSEGTTFGAFMTIFRSKNNKYISYFLKSSQFTAQIGLCFTSTINQLTNGILNNLFLAIPKEYSEQTAIANFLDYKTAKIDRFIRKKKQLIKLLNEQKAAIINDAVTKGVRRPLSGAEMQAAKTKPSGIEWLGDIPEHWEVRKLSTIINSAELGGNYISSLNGDGIPVMKMGNIDRGVIKLNKIEYLESETDFERKHILQNKDFLFNTRNSSELVGKVAIWRNEIPESLYNSNILKICFKKFISNEYMNYLFNSKSILNILKLISKGTTNVSAIYYKDLSKIEVWVPPLSEQKLIVTHIEKETAIIDKTIATIEKEISLVQEYRTALIAEAVTGKIDVRDYVLPLTAEEEDYETDEAEGIEAEVELENEEIA